jgi:hypothetical protein
MGTEAENVVIVLLGVKMDTAAGWLAQAKGVDAVATKNAAALTAVSAELADLHTNVGAADTAQSKAKNGGHDEVEARNAAIKTLKTSYREAVAAVQKQCNAQPDAEHARAYAALAGLRTKTVTPPTKAAFKGTALGNGRVYLAIKVPVRRGARVFYEWQMSTDGGKTWVACPNTNDPFTTVANLTPATYVCFRFSYTSKNTPAPWSAQVQVLVA